MPSYKSPVVTPDKKRSGILMLRCQISTHGMRAATLALMLSLLAGPAFAQRRQPPRSFGQVRLGPVYFTPQASLANIGIDTNAFNTQSASGQQLSAFTFSFYVGERIELVGRRLWFRSDLGGTYDYYSRRSPGQRPGLNPGLKDLSAELVAGPRLTLVSSGNRYTYVTDRPNFEVTSRATRLETLASLGLRYAFTPRLALVGEARTSSTHYDDSPGSAGYNLAVAFNGRRYDQTASIAYRLTPWTEVYLPVSWRHDHFDHLSDRTGSARSLGGGVRFNTRSLVSGSIELGRTSINTKSATASNAAFLSAQVLLRIRLSDTASVELSRQQNFSYSADVTRVYYIYRWYGMSLSQHLGERFDVRPFVYAFNYQTPGTSDRPSTTRVWGTDVGFARRRSRYAVVVTYTDGAVLSAPGTNYSRWRVGFSIGTPRLNIGDRGMFLNGALSLNSITP